MKRFFVKLSSAALSASLFALVAPAPMALAGTWSNHSSSICNHYWDSGSNGSIRFVETGILNSNLNSRYVVCPLVRRTSNSNGADIWVDVDHNGAQTTTCTAYSTSPGRYIATTQSSSGNGVGTMRLDLTGAGKSNWTSGYSVVCDIPGDYNGMLTGVRLDEK